MISRRAAGLKPEVSYIQAKEGGGGRKVGEPPPAILFT